MGVGDMKIVLFCALGMSTSLLVEKMKTAAKESSQQITIEAHSIDEFEKIGKTADVILLGPQIRYKKQALLKQTNGIPLDVIDAVAYGTLNGEKVLSQAQGLLDSKK